MTKRSKARADDSAVVIGGSMAGLLAARALAEHFAQVTIVERDDLADDAQSRRGVPQGQHTHVLLGGGCRALELLLPGLCAELESAGAVSGDGGANVRWFVEGGRFVRFSSGWTGLGMTRPLLEQYVRARIGRFPNIHRLTGRSVTGYAVSARAQRVIGVRLDDGNEVLAARLVVDAAGRGSRTPQWLEALGYERPARERLEIELRYTTRLFRRRSGDLESDNAAVLLPTPGAKRGGVLVAQEDDRWIVTLMTHFGDFAPASLEGFREFTRTLADPCIYDVIRSAQPLGEARTIRVPASIRHRYERLKRFPAGLLVLGDALSSFNPIYGQGMSVAALQAVELERALRIRRRDPARYFFPRAARIAGAAWAIAAGNDLRMKEVTGRRTLMTRLTNAYVPRLIRAGHRDQAAARAFLDVSNLIASPVSLLRPALVWRAFCARG